MAFDIGINLPQVSYFLRAWARSHEDHRRNAALARADVVVVVVGRREFVAPSSGVVA
jgi:hypothetical protein